MANYTSDRTGQAHDNDDTRITALESQISTMQNTIITLQQTINTINTDLSNSINTISTTLSNKANLSDVMIVRWGRAVESGNSTSSLGSANIYYHTMRINFGYTFSAVPAVSIVADDTAGGVFSAEIDGAVTNSYCDVTVYGPNTTNYACYWVAIGPR